MGEVFATYGFISTCFLADGSGESDGSEAFSPKKAELCRTRLDEQINMRRLLVKLTALIDWSETIARSRSRSLPAVVNTLMENPHWRFFCGEAYLQTILPIDPSSLTCWRKRVGEVGLVTLLAASIDVRRGGIVQKSSAQQVIVGTTVMPKAIAHPTDSRLLDKSRQHLVKAAEENGLRPRQNYMQPRGPRAPRGGPQSHVLPEAVKVQDLLHRTSRILPQRTKARTSCTPCTHPRWSCPARARPGHHTSSA